MTDFSSVEIPKPLDWQAFQRGCVPLFRKLVNDPTLVEFGRNGQDQKGIDLLGYRDGDISKPVGVQCRRVDTLSAAQIRKSVEEARAFKPPLTEIIFATTAKHDAKLQTDAHTLTAELVEGGWKCRIIVLGWDALQTEIATCPTARELFLPAALALVDTQQALVEAVRASEERIIEQFRVTHVAAVAHAPLDPKLPPEALNERPDIHAVISTWRDQLLSGQSRSAIRELERLRDSAADLPPFARFRIETNIAAGHLRAGRSEQALDHWRRAAALRPTDLKARANVALGLLASNDAASALALAEAILAEDPTLTAAICVRLQALEDDNIDPNSLVPDNLRDDLDVRASLIGVLRRRNDTTWRALAEAAAAEAVDDDRFKQWQAEAVLEPLLADSSIFIGQPLIGDDAKRATAAATALLELWNELSKAEELEVEPMTALAQNCAAALRLIDRPSESADIIEKAIALLGKQPALVRIRALLWSREGHTDRALAIVGDDPKEPDLVLLRAELIASTDLHAAATLIDTIDLTSIPSAMARTAVKVRIAIALDLADFAGAETWFTTLANLQEPAAGLALARARIAQRQAPPSETAPTSTELLGGEELDEVAVDHSPEDLALLETLNQGDIEFLTRVSAAEYLAERHDFVSASNVLHGAVDLQRDTLALRLYLGSTLSAGLYVRARDAVAALPSPVAESEYYKRLRATLLWNAADIRGAARLIADLRQQYPDTLEYLTWHIDALVRVGAETEVRQLLADVDENSFSPNVQQQIRLARALSGFGQELRGLRLAYRLFLTNRDEPDAWLGYTSILFTMPRQSGPDLLRTVVDDEAVIEIEAADGEKLTYGLEENAELRKTTEHAIDPSHPIAAATRGRTIGDEFDYPGGGIGKILSVKNKYLHCFHTALTRYNTQFPNARGLQRVQVDLEKPGGLAQIKAHTAARSRYVQDQARVYAAGSSSLGTLACAIGVDPVEAMLGLGEVDIPFKVATGFEPERAEAFVAMIGNAKKGCVLDGVTLHIVRRLALESVVSAVCGPIGVAQVTLDRLRRRLERISEDGPQMAGTLGLADDQLVAASIGQDALDRARAVLREDIGWVEQNATILPALPARDPPPLIVNSNRLLPDRIFDDIFAASGADRILVAEDLYTRWIAREMGVVGTWLQPILMRAEARGLIATSDYARVLSELAEIGEDFLTVEGHTLAAAYRLDIDDGTPAPGRRLKGAFRCIGGQQADPASHIGAVLDCLEEIWSGAPDVPQVQAATSALLRQLIRERHRDYRAIIVALLQRARRNAVVHNFILGWARGHFLLA